MKKLLLTSVALGSMAAASAPAYANEDGVKLDLGGFYKGYMTYINQDEVGANDANEFDFLRDTELHIGGETTLDNGLTIGSHFEIDIDQADSSEIDESYLYFSGDWGRVNIGGEDGIGYLLQVAAPSADSNIDGIRQYIDPTSYAALGLTDPVGGLDYDMDPTEKADKITYITPSISGFQAGVSFAPDSDDADSFGVGTESAGIDETYEIALRYAGEFGDFGVTAGAGYTHGENNDTAATADDRDMFNAAVKATVASFGFGAAYTEDSTATDNSDVEDFVVGGDYTTGPFKLGISYSNRDIEGGTEFDRYTGGVTYEFGPGMDLRGSVQHLEIDTSTQEYDSTSLIIGTQISF